MNTELKKLKELTENVKMVMFSTLAEDGTIHSRPMATQEMDQNGNLWFFTSIDSGKVASIKERSELNLAYADPNAGTYVSVVGECEVVQDKAKEKDLWKPILKAWFPKGLEDPELCLLKVTAKSAEFWDAPQGRMIQFLGMVKAGLAGQTYQPKSGEHGKIDLNTRY